jgi:hypothetical protein
VGRIVQSGAMVRRPGRGRCALMSVREAHDCCDECQVQKPSHSRRYRISIVDLPRYHCMISAGWWDLACSSGNVFPYSAQAYSSAPGYMLALCGLVLDAMTRVQTTPERTMQVNLRPYNK